MRYLFLLLLFACGNTDTNTVSPRPTQTEPVKEKDLKVYAHKFFIGRLDTNKKVEAGTGFFTRYQDRIYFVTARHNLYDPETNERRNRYFKVRVYNFNGEPVDVDIDIESVQNEVIEHKIKGQFADFVLIRIPWVLENLKVEYLDMFSSDISEAEVVKGGDAYFYGFRVDDKYCTEVRSKLASNFLDQSGKDKQDWFITDAKSMKGMSGGPLFYVIRTNDKFRYRLIGLISSNDTKGEFAGKSRFLSIEFVKDKLKAISANQ